jgi:hypothetical protein
MADNKHWLPDKEADLLDLIKVWDRMLADTQNRTDYGWDATKCAKVQAAMDAFVTAVADYKDNDSTKNLKAKKAARKKAAAAMRSFARTDVRENDEMPDTVKEEMSVHVRDKVHTPKGQPTEFVEFVLDYILASHTITALYHILGRDSKGKGPYHGAEIRFWVLPVGAPPPPSGEHPGWRSEICTASPWTWTFDEAEFGMVVYVAMRWENPAVSKKHPAAKGPWSVIQSMAIH